MKKSVLLLALLLLSFATSAQVKIFTGKLDDALLKAKAENKDVMVMASATW